MINKKIKYLLFAGYLNLFAFAFFTPLFALFVGKLSANPADVGIAWGVNLYAAALMIIISGRYEDRIKSKEKMVVAGYFLMAAGAAAYLLVHTMAELYLVQLFNAVGVGLLTPAWRTLYSKKEDKGRETLEWSLADGGARFFGATGAVIGGFILKYSSFMTIFVMIAAIQLIAAGVSMSLLNKD